VTIPGEFIRVSANGLDFEVLAVGEGDRLALCLHGFPEHAISWRAQIPLLVSLGYRVWAPNQRGYGNSSRPKKIEDYAIPCLLDDITALIDASGATSVTLIGHDWGAVLCWFYAMRPVRPIERLVIMNVPHPKIFSRVLRTSWRQRLRSWYILFFQLPRLPEWLLGLNGARAIGEMFRGSATDPAQFPDDVIDVYRAQASRPGALTAMINWYRAAARIRRQGERTPTPRITIPTLMLWGEEDVALGKETTYGTREYVSDLQLHYLPGVSHWVQQDAPERVNEELRRFLDESHASKVEAEDSGAPVPTG
jgi:pimeloyl-ACP methyl ester carboxylesterase